MSIIVPEYAKNAVTTSVDEEAAPSLNYLSFNSNGKFVFRQGSDEKKLGDEVKIVILSVNPSKNFINARAYWPGKYDPSNTAPPECASPGGLKPFDWLEDPQADACNKCEWSVLGSSGYGKSSQCKAFKMVYFVFADNVKSGIAAFRVPVTSLKSLGTYRWDVSQLNVPIAGVITKLTFDPDAEYTKPAFGFGGFLPESDFAYATKLAGSSEVAQLAGSNQQVAQIAAPAETPTTNKKDTIDLEKSQEAATDDVVDSVADLLSMGTLEPAEEEKPVLSLIDTISNKLQDISSIADLQAYVSEIKTDIKESEDAIKIKELLSAKVKELQKPAMQMKIESVKKAGLFELLSEICTLDRVAQAKYLGIFTSKASELNGTAFNSEIHGIKNNGYPAVAKDGSFKRSKKSVDKAQIEEAPAKDVLDMLTEA